MKKTVLLMSVLSLALLGCEKENDKEDEKKPASKTECEKKNVGYLKVVNNSDCPFDILEKSTSDLLGKSGAHVTLDNIELAPKSYTIQAYYLISGRSFFHEFTVNITKCNTSTITLTSAHDQRYNCEKEKTGNIVFWNQSKDDYDVYINNTFKFTIEGWYTHPIDLPGGYTYNIQVKQKNGYILYPTVKNYTVSLSVCDEKRINFP